MKKLYDLAIIGTGPAGYTASIYASRYNIFHILVGKVTGGLTLQAHKICNFPGQNNISGIELMQNFQKHAKELGALEIQTEVTNISKHDNQFVVTTQDQNKLHAKTVLLAIGTTQRKLNLQGENNFIGKGVSYCSTCDGHFFKNKIVAVVGGGDAANTSSLHLAQIASKVFQIYRGSKLRGEPSWVKQVLKQPNIEIIYRKTIVKLHGTGKLEAITLDNGSKLKVDGLFIEIGSVPNTAIIKNLNVKTDNAGFIEVDPTQETNIKGVWAAGDITTASDNFKQIITAASEAAIAIKNIFSNLAKSKSIK